MPRVARRQLADGFFHTTAHSIRGAMLFETDLDRLDFLGLLHSTVDRYSWKCHAHCLMGTHYHLVLEATLNDLSRGMQRLNGDYARRFNHRHGTTGHLFAERFSSFVLEDEAHFHAAISYVRENPVRAGLCSRAEDWPWSS